MSTDNGGADTIKVTVEQDLVRLLPVPEKVTLYVPGEVDVVVETMAVVVAEGTAPLLEKLKVGATEYAGDEDSVGEEENVTP